MHGRAPGVVGCPPNNGQVLLSQFELRPLDDSDARDFWSSWTYLRGHRLWGEQTTDRSHCGESWKQFIHVQTLKGAASNPHASWTTEQADWEQAIRRRCPIRRAEVAELG